MSKRVAHCLKDCFLLLKWLPSFHATKLKPTSQYNVNRAVTGRYLPDAYFSRSAAHRPIFLTLNHVVKSASGRLTAAAGRLFGHRSISSGNDQIFGRCPADAPPMSRRQSSGGSAVTVGAPVDHWQTTMNPAIIGRSPFGERSAIDGFALG